MHNYLTQFGGRSEAIWLPDKFPEQRVAIISVSLSLALNADLIAPRGVCVRMQFERAKYVNEFFCVSKPPK